MTEPKRPITAEDLLSLQTVAAPQISPDGQRVAFVRRYIDAEKNKTRSEIWLGPADASTPPRRWTGGAWSDGEPRWSPDGSQIAFVSNRVDEKAQIYLLPTNGGEARALTTLDEGGIQSPRWSPDGTKIAFLFRATPAAYTKKATDERKSKGLSSPPRVHTRLFYRLDGFGYWDDSFWQVWVADAVTGEAKALTSGDFICHDVCWSPDSQTLAFLSDRRPDWDADSASQTDIWTVPTGGGKLTQVPSPQGDKQGLALSSYGVNFAYVGNPDPLDQWGTRNERVYVLPIPDGGRVLDMTADTDKAVGFLTLSDTRDNGGILVAWDDGYPAVAGKLGQGVGLLCPISEQGTTRLYRIDLEDESLMPLTPADREMGSFSVSNGMVAVTLGDATHPHEVFVIERSADAPMRQLSDLNRDWLNEIHLQTPEPLTGNVPGWLLTPPEFKPDSTAPLVLYVHGGPHLQYGNALFHELQWLAAQGYVVAYTNPRGSKGYGEAHTGAIKGDWGGPALEDVLAVVDEAIERGYADPNKLAIMGGSYGGYLTAWAVGHTDRFACAIADRLVANLHSMSGTCDFPWSHGTYYQGNAWEDPSDLWRHSPLAFAEKINTPLLLIHSDGDLRCPIGQAEELFAALRLQKKAVEFVRYPAETSHGLSRGGPPDLRLDRLRRNLDWLDKYLRGENA